MAHVIAPVNANTVVMALTREAMAPSEKSHRVVGAVSGVRVSRGAVLSASTQRTSTSYNGVLLLCSVLLLMSCCGTGTEVMKVITTFFPATSNLTDVTLSPTAHSIYTTPAVSEKTGSNYPSVGIIAGIGGAVVLLSVAVVLMLFVFHRKCKKDKIERTSVFTARTAGTVMTENEAYGLTPTAPTSNSGQVLTPSLLSAAQAGIPLYSTIPEQEPAVVAIPVYEDVEEVKGVCGHVETIQPYKLHPLP